MLLTIENNGFYLFLDDERDSKTVHPKSRPGMWTTARSSEEAKALVLEHGMPIRMSLDHDLGGDDTTMSFLHWLSEQGGLLTRYPDGSHEGLIPSYVVHSANPVGRDNMISFMESWSNSAPF